MFDWKATLLRPHNTLKEAIEVLNRASLQIVMVIDEHNKLQGTITDGDIRRALMKHHGMETHLRDIMFKESTTALINENQEVILKMMKERCLLQVPLLNSEGCVVGLETLHNLVDKQRHDNAVLLMAGGRGKRLLPLTKDTPKPLLKVGGKPILETILSQFVDAGFHKFFLATHYKAEMLKEHFGDGSKWGVEINYLFEEEPLGTAGALGLLPEGLPDAPIIFMNADLLTKVNFEHLLNFHLQQGGMATMCVCKYDFQVPYGVIESEDLRVKNIVEKPVQSFFVNAGIYALDPDIVNHINGNEHTDMPCLLESLIGKDKQVNMFPMHEYWLDIGKLEQFERAQLDIKNMTL